MDRTVRENALALADQIARAEAGDDPMLPGVLRGLRLVIGRYLDGNPSETGPEDGIHPARARMRELLAARGPDGYRAGVLWMLLQAEGYVVARETAQRWLAADEVLGMAERHGIARAGSSKWVAT